MKIKNIPSFFLQSFLIDLEYTMEQLVTITSPLDQFEIRNFISLELPILANMQLSLTNIGFYLIISLSVAVILSLLASNSNKIVSNSWSLSQESVYTTVNNVVLNQISASKGQIYFPFIYSLFIFILVNNLLGMVLPGAHVIVQTMFICQHYQRAKFSSSRSNSLHPYFTTGFIDGEGCFNLSIYRDSRMNTGWQVKPVFFN